MTIRHYLMGYDKAGSALAVEFPVKLEHLVLIRSIVSPDPSDPDLIDPIALASHQAEAIAEITGRRLNGGAYDFFLQAFEEASEIGQAA
jgi:hypothetical protein